MGTMRISLDGRFFGFDTSLLSIHTIAHGACEANGCHIGIGVILGGWVEGYHRTGLRW